MNALVRFRPPPPDPIGATLLFSLVLHGIVLFGIGFRMERSQPELPTLDVTLVQVTNGQTPHKAEFLAQTNNQGGGDRDQAARPAELFSGQLPKPTPGIAPLPVDAATPSPQQASLEHRLTTTGQGHFEIGSDTAHEPTDQPSTDDDKELRIQQEMAQLAAEIRHQREAYAKRPKKKFIDASTKEYAYAAYERFWADRVERIGNLNYPGTARERHLRGEVVLTVTLTRNGNVKAIDIVHGSGQELLDRATVQIVRLAAPFPPIPSHEQVDELYITRTWVYGPGDVLSDR